jgi:hypothetical protein
VTNSMTETKPWWQSRTVWAAIVGMIYPIVNMSGWLPPELTTEITLEAVMIAVSSAALYFRIKAEKKLTVVDSDASA